MIAGAPPRLTVVILAAGFSSRLGRPKALVRLGKCSLLRRTAEIAQAFGPVVVVVPPRSDRYAREIRGLDAVTLVNRERDQGLSSSVRCALRAARFSSGVLILPVDMAGLRERELQRLVARWHGAPRRVAARRLAGAVLTENSAKSPDAASNESAGANTSSAAPPFAGVPLILPRWLFPNAFTIAGDVGLRELIKSLTPDQVALVDIPSASLDIDTPGDLDLARRRGLSHRG